MISKQPAFEVILQNISSAGLVLHLIKFQLCAEEIFVNKFLLVIMKISFKYPLLRVAL
jgi:hypothetical protein